MLALVALPCSAQAQDGDYPAGAVLAAFATACSGVEDTAVNLASAEASGWERLAADADTPINTLVRQGEEALAASVEEEGGEAPQRLGSGEFRKVVAERTLYLAISGLMLGDIATRGCRLFDFDAPRGLTAEELEQWAVRAPNDRQELPGGSTKATFNPGLKPGHMEMEAYFVPAGAQPLPGIDLRGIGLVATAIEFVP
ncbi:MAG TPA: hypothetical protein VI168_09810 [Croceibacterium sp.]